MCFAQQATSGRLSARLSAVEHNQAEFRRQQTESLLASQNHELALKDVNVTLSSLAAMVSSLMNKLESKTSVSEPKTTANTEDLHGGIPKCACENQTESPTARVGTSNTLPVDVVADSSARSERGGQPKTYTRMTKSKDAKLKGVYVSQETSPEAGKGRGGEVAVKKVRAPKGGVKKRVGAEAAIGHPKPPTNVGQVDGAVDGGCADVGSGPPKVAVAGIAVEGSGEGGGARGE